MNHSKTATFIILLASICMLAFSFTSCTESQNTISDAISEEEFAPENSELVVKGGPNLVEITTGHYHDYDNDEHNHSFDLNVDEVPEGWTRFQLTNGTNYDHFVLLYEVPQEAIVAAEEAGETVLEHWIQSVTVPFQDEYSPYFNEDIEYGTFVNNLVGKMLGTPEVPGTAPWFFNPGATTMGGPGITAAGYTSQTTVELTEGIYIAECYVKDDNGEFHSYNGMIEMLTVTGESSKEREPKATMKVSISSEKGIEHPDAVRPGKQTVAIHFDDQTGYDHLLGHNVQLVRFDDGYDQALLDELGAWMDWSAREGLIDNSPDGTTFLGGAMEMPGGSTAYYTVNLKPGTYAWIAEVPDASDTGKNMLKTFSVPFGRNVK